MSKIRIAFVKFGGLSAGGTERWLQMMAANLPKERFDVDYYFCGSAPYVGSTWVHPDTDPHRRAYMEGHGINLIEFHVGKKDLTRKHHPWLDTDFWEMFQEDKYDFIQTAKAGPREFPYFLLKKPIVECVSLSAGVDFSSNIAWTVHLSSWQRDRWLAEGGHAGTSSVIYIPADVPLNGGDFRGELGIPEDAIVAGFHQRAENTIMSSVPLAAFARCEKEGRHFAIMGGGEAYRLQAAELQLKNVHFLEHSGDSERIARFLRTLNIFAHGRRDGETFGTVFAEAMMCGKPCLGHASAIANGHEETIGPAGYFAQNLDEYSEYLNDLFEDSTLRSVFGERAREHANQNYSVNAAIEALIRIYDALTSPGCRRRPQWPGRLMTLRQGIGKGVRWGLKSLRR